jgi:hypothetical protein
VEAGVSVYLDYLADELAEIEQTLAGPELAPFADRLRKAIAKARILTLEAGSVSARRPAAARTAFLSAA